MQEGTCRLRGYPVRSAFDVMLIFSANPETTRAGQDYHAAKDRIGAEIMTHYPADLQTASRFTRQEAWVDRDGWSNELAQGLERPFADPRFIRERLSRSL